MKVSFGRSTSLERCPVKSLSSMLLPVRPSLLKIGSLDFFDVVRGDS